MVKLLTPWVKDHDSKVPHEYFISNGIWETTGVQETERGKIFTLTCIIPYSKSISKGAKREMLESVLVELCHMVKIIHLPKLPSMIKPIK